MKAMRWSFISVLAGSLGLAACSAPPGSGTESDSETSGDGDLVGDGDGLEIDQQSSRTRCEATQTINADLRRMTALEFQATLADIFPEAVSSWTGVALGADPVGPLGFTNDTRLLVVGPQSAEEIFRTGGDIAAVITSAGVLETVLPCSASADRACASVFLDTYGERMYRRALNEVERNELLDYFDSVLGRSDFATGMKWMITAMVQSPFFVYRSELGDASGNLSPEEVATQLSFIYSGKGPTTDQLNRARAGEFATPEGRTAEAGRLAAADANHEILMRFLNEWTGYKKVESAVKLGLEDKIVELRESMVKETEMFFQDVVIASGGGVDALLTSNTTFTDAVLAEHYGFGEAGADLAKTTRPDGQGLGLLAQGSLLSAAAHPDVSSPVFRGLFVFEKLLCNEEPVIPPGLEITPIAEQPLANTTRERFEIVHAADPGCKSCHETFEPFGFGMEDFDQAGRYRTEEFNVDQGVAYPIDAAATANAPDGVLSFNGTSDLATQLAELPAVTDCVSGLLAAYAYSGGGGIACLAEPERDALLDGTVGLYNYYIQLAASPNMVQRAR